MPSMNEATIMGHLGADPDIMVMQSGQRVANLSIATSEVWKDKTTGEKKEKTEWHRVVVFNQPFVDVLEKYVHKGDCLLVRGSIETRSWDEDGGNTRYMTEIVLRPFGSMLKMMPRGASGAGTSSTSPSPSKPKDAGAAAAYDAYAPDPKSGGAGFSEDEIPF